MGPGADDATDGEHPPVYLPSINSGDNRCSMKKALRGSSVELSSKLQETQKTSKKSLKASNNPSKSPSKSPKHSNNKDCSYSSPQRTSRDSHKNKDNSVNNCVNNTNVSVSSPRMMPKHSSDVNKTISGATPKSPKSPHISKHRSHKTSVPHTDNNNTTSNTNSNTGPGGSEELWIDGPRFHKSKVYDGHKSKGYEMETWIDGPEATYGYMDDHKKVMIQKWVETQNAQVTSSKPTENSSQNKKHSQYKELTQFKQVDEEEVSPKHKDKHREKRKSSECKEIRNTGKGFTGVAKDKDSPHRRRSYQDKPSQQHNHIESEFNRTKNQDCASGSTPTKSTYQSKEEKPYDNQTEINHDKSVTNNHIEEVPNLSPHLNSTKQIPNKIQNYSVNKIKNRNSLQSIVNVENNKENGKNNECINGVSNYHNNDNVATVSPMINNMKSSSDKLRKKQSGKKDGESNQEDEEDEVLQVICVETKEGNVDTHIHQTKTLGE